MYLCTTPYTTWTHAYMFVVLYVRVHVLCTRTSPQENLSCIVYLFTLLLWLWDRMDVNTNMLPYYYLRKKLQIDKVVAKVLLSDNYQVILSTIIEAK